MYIDVRVWPLVYGVGCSRSITEDSRAIWRFDGKALWSAFLWIVCSKARGICSRDNVECACSRQEVFDKQYGSEMAGWLVGVSAAKHQHRDSIIASFHNVDFCIAGAAFQSRKPVRKHLYFRNTGSAHNLIGLSHRQKRGTCKR